MFWERKIQLAKEMKSAVDSETGQGEIKAMKSEIHRMQVRYDQLLRQQEKLIRDMESSVLRRDTIITRGEFQQKLPQNKAIMQSTIQKKISDLQKKIRETTQVKLSFQNSILNIISSHFSKVLNLNNNLKNINLINKNM